MQIVLNIVPVTAKKSIEPRLSKNGLFGIRKPASNMMGGSMQKKKISGDTGDRTFAFVK